MRHTPYRKDFRFFLLFTIVLLLQSCIARDKKRTDVTDPGTIYFDYKITAEEGNDNLTVLLQYRDWDEEGDALSLSGLAKVLLDGEELSLDSTRRTGFFYELHKPIAVFSGTHSIALKGTDGKEYLEEFNFQPMVLQTAIADTIGREELVFEFLGLEPEDYVRVLLTDTSFVNDGINRVDTVYDGRLVIPAADMKNLATGPLQLEFIREYERPVKNATKRGGRLLITYSLKRKFFLKDQPEK